MKIAAADYDGTLFRGRTVSTEDLAAIALWRAQGGLFGIATGRDLSLTAPEVRNWSIPVDFLVCNNGAAVYGADFSPVSALNLPQGTAPAVINHPAARNSHYYLLARNGSSYLLAIRPRSWFSGLNLPLIPVSRAEALTMEGLQQMSLAFDSAEEAARCAQTLTGDFGGRLMAQENGICVDLNAPGVDKGHGLELLLRARRWRPDQMLVIGDGENDLPMIRRFSGFTMREARDSVKAEARGVYDSVAACLLDHLKKT